MYFTGDGCKRDEDGYYRITGRVDDIIIVSGHNLGTAEIESAIDEHSVVCETAVVGFPHDIKGQGIYAFVICHDSPAEEGNLRKEILETVSKIIGPEFCERSLKATLKTLAIHPLCSTRPSWKRSKPVPCKPPA
jgi:acetyl-CoA synthetase